MKLPNSRLIMAFSAVLCMSVIPKSSSLKRHMALVNQVYRGYLQPLSAIRGNSFFDNLKKPIFVSAPMVDHSELAFRLLVKNNGADLAFSQMMHARNFVTDPRYRGECIDWMDYSHSSGDISLSEKARQIDRPLIVQLAGDDPEILVKAGSLVHHHDITAIDLNLGCPQKIAKRGNYGAYLLPNKVLVKTLLSEMVKRLDCPVTVKIRRLSTDEETLELVHELEQTGIKMITVHGRTVEQNKLFTGSVDWEIIRKIKEMVNIPVIANGGISCYNDIEKCLQYTKADGVMSSEALLENPKLFSKNGDFQFHNNYINAQFETVDEYLNIMQSYPFPIHIINTVRSHLFPILFRFIHSPKHLDLRRKLAEGDFIQMVEVVEELKQRMSVVDFNMNIALEQGLISENTWYMRHRGVSADNRILSRNKAINIIQEKQKVIQRNILNCEENVNLQDKLTNLKLKLQKKRQNESVVAQGSMSSKA
eukprot:gene12477-26247_t